MNTNEKCATLINAFWHERGLDPQARIETTTVETVADEYVPILDERGEIARGEDGRPLKEWRRKVRRSCTQSVVVSNMRDGYPTERLKAAAE